MQTKKTDTSKSGKAAAMAGKTWTILKSETTGFVIGLLFVIFGCILLLVASWYSLDWSVCDFSRGCVSFRQSAMYTAVSLRDGRTYKPMAALDC